MGITIVVGVKNWPRESDFSNHGSFLKSISTLCHVFFNPFSWTVFNRQWVFPILPRRALTCREATFLARALLLKSLAFMLQRPPNWSNMNFERSDERWELGGFAPRPPDLARGQWGSSKKYHISITRVIMLCTAIWVIFLLLMRCVHLLMSCLSSIGLLPCI